MKSITIGIAALAIVLNIRANENPSAEIGTGPSAELRAGRHLFILSGQSNMYHMKGRKSFIPTVTKAFGKDNVIVAENAKRGAPIRMWDKDYKWPDGRAIPQGRMRPGKKKIDRKAFEAGFGTLYEKLMNEVKRCTKGKTFDTVTFVWMQGESDAGGKLSHLYADSFNRVVARLKGDLKITSINIVIGRLSDYGMNNPEWVKMRKLQVKYAEDTPNCEWVDCDDLNDFTENGETRNGLHYTKDGYKILGQRFAEKAIELIKKNSPKQNPKETAK